MFIEGIFVLFLAKDQVKLCKWNESETAAMQGNEVNYKASRGTFRCSFDAEDDTVKTDNVCQNSDDVSIFTAKDQN